MTEHLEGEQPSWAVVETRANAETQAEQFLIRIHYEPLVVRYNKLIRGARIANDGNRVRSRQDSIQPRPFIPGYLFLPLIQGDDATLVDGREGKAAGIKRLFRNRDADGYLAKPKLIRARIVEQIRLAAIEKDETPKSARDDLKNLIEETGEATTRHPVTGMILHLTSLDDKGRAEYFTELMGARIMGRIEDTAELELLTP